MSSEQFPNHALSRPTLRVSVVMRKEPITGPMRRWQESRWVLDEILDESSFPSQDLPHSATAQQQSRLLHKTDTEERHLHTGFDVSLYRDDTDGYYLNLTSQAPCWFVLWRMEDDLAKPAAVSLSYHDAGRWLDAQETVDQLPAPAAVVEWLQHFVDEFHVEEPRRRKRPESFKSLSDRFGNPASISTEKLRGGKNNHGG